MPGFLDRLFGRGKDRSSGLISRSDDAAADDDLDDDPDDEDSGPFVVEQMYLEFVGGSSAKFYAVVLSGDEDEEWSVWFNYGRIGHPREWATKVEYTEEEEAREVFDALIAEKGRGGYGEQPWPPTLEPPDGLSGATASPGPAEQPERAGPVAYEASAPGTLPAAQGGRVGGIDLPAGVLVAPDDGKSSAPVIWISATPVDDVAASWQRLVAVFHETGLWPLVMDLEIEPAAMSEIFLETGQAGRVGGRDARAILADWWSEGDDGEGPRSRRFPGLAAPTPGERPTRIDDIVTGLTGHLGLVAVSRPADVLAATAWLGAANYDADPGDQSTVLRSWETRFDAYLVGLGWDTIHLAVGRPPLDRPSAMAIGAEHWAFCTDNIDQGVGELKPYAQELIGERIWPFWWD